ncbi:hypothetical protein Vretimale_7432 [Volvox reticuliferus]|uniref:Uncharacterized protein n=1 Tax=Volvox reticuliferus TaxID=1737510 RepID=A0A8J4G9M9_9CHLO|nr:hypothetical protein Vretifemale_7553 [Volvox reticuliferus]GIM02646.1 hypothetical protein Vretimale_7432 [Volvox reticuliferus]
MANFTKHILILWLCYMSYNLGSAAATNFDYFVLVRQWLGSVCSTTSPCPLVQNIGYTFTIHGLWPTNNSRPYPRNCDPSKPFDSGNVASIRGELETYWPSTGHTYEWFWGHEWDAHGTCALSVFPTQLAYFRGVLDLNHNYNLENTLSAAGIQPSNSQYTSTAVVRALQSRFGGPQLSCYPNGNLKEVWMCFRKDLTPINCPTGLVGSSACGPNLKIPPLTGNQVTTTLLTRSPSAVPASNATTIDAPAATPAADAPAATAAAADDATATAAAHAAATAARAAATAAHAAATAAHAAATAADAAATAADAAATAARAAATAADAAATALEVAITAAKPSLVKHVEPADEGLTGGAGLGPCTGGIDDPAAVRTCLFSSTAPSVDQFTTTATAANMASSSHHGHHHEHEGAAAGTHDHDDRHVATSFDYFMLARQWLGTSCTDEKPCYREKVATTGNKFTIHGLWPTNHTGDQPKNCNRDYPFKLRELDDSIMEELVEYWPSVTRRSTTKFWAYEWEKHGTCALSVFPTELKYFEAVLKLHRTYNLEDVLEERGFKASDTRSYDTTAVSNAIKDAYHAQPVLTCDTEGNLREVRMCIRRDQGDLTAFDCTDQRGSCRSPEIMIKIPMIL